MEIDAPFVLIDDAHAENGPATDARMRLYANPIKVLTCHKAEEVAPTLAAIDAALADGLHVAGYLAYELGYALEPKLTKLLPDDQSSALIWMGVFAEPRLLDANEGQSLLNDWARAGHTVGALSAGLTQDDYLGKIETVQAHIRAGDVYQINFTFQQKFGFSGSPLSLYAALRERQRASFGALIHTGSQHILSLSPELFVRVQDGTAHTRPMKGTAARGPSNETDAAQRHWLKLDEKSKAENLMIVDLLRNDLGRVSQIGTVEVSDLFTVETYPTLHQMTSGIQAELKEGTAFSDLVGALFPCGSVTGAPKVKAMEIIRSLESQPRGVYTGAIGYAAKNDARLNVAIRTLCIADDDQGAQVGTMGIGSGIVFDSDGPEEWLECHLKAHFLTRPQTPFALLETLKWDARDGFALLHRHLGRLAQSAAYFCYPYDAQAVINALNAAVAGCTTPQRVRLTLDGRGDVAVQTQDLAPLGRDGVLTVALSDLCLDSSSPFLFHKTTNRAFYDDERLRLSALTGCDEVLFFNASGQLTEGSFTTVFVEKDGTLLTPPTSCGLLAGTLRQDMLDSGQARESILTRADLHAPHRVFVGNAVRGLMGANVLFPKD